MGTCRCHWDFIHVCLTYQQHFPGSSSFIQGEFYNHLCNSAELSHFLEMYEGLTVACTPPSQTPLVPVVFLGFPKAPGPLSAPIVPLPLLSDMIPLDEWGRPGPSTSHLKLFPIWEAEGTFRFTSARIRNCLKILISKGFTQSLIYLILYLALFDLFWLSLGPQAREEFSIKPRIYIHSAFSAGK